MVDILGYSITKTTNAMAQQVKDTYSTLDRMGVLVKVGQEAAARHDEIAELDGWIKSPLTKVPDKVDHMDSLIDRNIQYGYGRVDQFWDFVFNTWKKGYHKVWLPMLSTSLPPVSYKYNVLYKEEVLGQDLKPGLVERMAQLSGDTVMYLLTNRARYPEVKVLEKVKIEFRRTEHYNPNVDYDQRYKQAMDFGMEEVLNWGWMTLNYLMHPEHINPAYVLVIQATPQQQQFGGGAAAASDFTGKVAPPPGMSIPAKVQHQ